MIEDSVVGGNGGPCWTLDTGFGFDRTGVAKDKVDYYRFGKIKVILSNLGLNAYRYAGLVLQGLTGVLENGHSWPGNYTDSLMMRCGAPVERGC